MIQRILHGWTAMRAFYLLVGSMIIIQSIAEGQWLLSIMGGYFASMGLFNYGCAAGACYIPYSKQPQASPVKAVDTDYEEIKAKN